MAIASASTAFDEYSDRLLTRVASRDDVLGLVFLGSGADRDRLDEWSDHDFFLVVAEGAQEGLRTTLDWLPDHQSIVLAARETEHGLKVVHADGHVLEFAVATLAELATFSANSWVVILDRGGVADTMGEIAARPKPGDTADDGRDIRLFLTLLLIGTGRARRGELLTAGESVREYALGHLLSVWRRRLPTPDAPKLDNLDVRRRFELVYPDAEIASLLERDPESAARALLDLAERRLAPGWHEWPTDAVSAVRRRLRWDAPAP